MPSSSPKSLNTILEHAAKTPASTAPPTILAAMLLCPNLDPDQALDKAQSEKIESRWRLLRDNYLKTVKNNRELFRESLGRGARPSVACIAPTLSLWKDIKDGEQQGYTLDDDWLATPLLGEDPTKRFRHLTFRALYEQAKAKNEQADRELMQIAESSTEFRLFSQRCATIQDSERVKLGTERTSGPLAELIALKRASLLSTSHWHTIAGLVAKDHCLLYEDVVKEDPLADILRELFGHAHPLDRITSLSECNNNIYDFYKTKLPKSIKKYQGSDEIDSYLITYSFFHALFWSVSYFLSRHYRIVFPLNYGRILLICFTIGTIATICTLVPISSQALGRAKKILRSPRIENIIHNHYQRRRQDTISTIQDCFEFTFSTMVEACKDYPAQLNRILSEAKQKLSNKKGVINDDAIERVIASWGEILTSSTLSHEDQCLYMAIILKLYKENENIIEDSNHEIRGTDRLWRIEDDLNICVRLKSIQHLKKTRPSYLDVESLVPNILVYMILRTLEALAYFAVYKIAHLANPKLQEKSLWLIVFLVILYIYMSFIIGNLELNPYDFNAAFKLGTYEGWNAPCEELSSEPTTSEEYDSKAHEDNPLLALGAGSP